MVRNGRSPPLLMSEFACLVVMGTYHRADRQQKTNVIVDVERNHYTIIISINLPTNASAKGL